MRKTTSLLLAVSAVAVSGCGSSGAFANKPPPAQPVDLTVYINSAKVSVSPATVGAGPVVFTVTNQSTQSESLAILPAGASAGQALADTGPINPQGTAQVTVNFSSQGDYTVGTTAGGPSDASQSQGSSIQAATIHIGPQRANSSGQLLNP